MFTLKRQTAHLSPILSGDCTATEFSSSSSSSSSTPHCAPPPPPSAAVSSSNSLDDLDKDEPNWKTPEMPRWRKSRTNNPTEQVPSKMRKLGNWDNQREYASIRKKSTRRVKFGKQDENGDSTCDESEGSFWSESVASYGFSKYIQPISTGRVFPCLQPPPPSPTVQQRQSGLVSFPRTNPLATLPRLHRTTAHVWPSSESSSTTGTTSGSSDTPDSAWGYDHLSILHSSMANAQRRRILAGLKAFGIKGELLINIILNRGLITVTIEQARNLVSPAGGPCCSTYVRLSLMPDEEKRTQCKTELIPYTNRPVFHQTFTVELLPEDYEKRLVISMWHRETANEKSVLLGCMAFTVRHMVESNKVVDGWYFLLAPRYGRKKHLAVHKVNMLTYYGSVDSDQESNSANSINL